MSFKEDLINILEAHDGSVEICAIKKFVNWCYLNGIDFSYMSTNELSASEFCDKIIKRYFAERSKE